MQARDQFLHRFLEGDKQFVVPMYQRRYSWEKEQCQQLWDDIIRVGGEDNSSENHHFIGSVVYIPDEDKSSATVPHWFLIDGQQRITTITLLLIALVEKLKICSDQPIKPDQISENFLINRHLCDEARYKILLTKNDHTALVDILDGKNETDEMEGRIKTNYSFFRKCIEGACLETVHRGFRRLKVVEVTLRRGTDNPQMIFESMNSTGKALTDADLVRNYVLMGEDLENQNRLYCEYWLPMEKNFGDGYDELFNFFLWCYLIIEEKGKVKQSDVYAQFKIHSKVGDSKEKMLSRMETYAKYYCRIAFLQESDIDLKEAMKNFNYLGYSVCHPLLIIVYWCYDKLEIVSKQDFVSIIRLVESYTLRRSICDIPTNSQRDTFVSLTRGVKTLADEINQNSEKNLLDYIKTYFCRLKSYKRFPKDDEFAKDLKEREIYGTKNLTYVMRRLENYGRKKELTETGDYTIEHIMPRTLNEKWKSSLGEKWEDVYDKYLHSLGNLTLTGYNSEYSNRSFAEKRDMKEEGFSSSPLRLNKGLGGLENWNEKTIKDRAERLAKESLNIWEYPQISEKDMARYFEAKDDQKGEYNIEDHPRLQHGTVAEIFVALRREILALDENVEERFLKNYVAYSAESNIVSLLGQSKRIQILLNIDYRSINDSRNLCEDVSGKGRLGSGETRVYLADMKDLPYIVNLIRQAWESQMED